MPVQMRTVADVGAAIRARRRALGIDQGELARRIGASRLWVNQIERGKPGAGLGLVLRAFAALDITLIGTDPGEREHEDGTHLPSIPSLDINAIIDGLRRKTAP